MKGSLTMLITLVNKCAVLIFSRQCNEKQVCTCDKYFIVCNWERHAQWKKRNTALELIDNMKLVENQLKLLVATTFVLLQSICM